MQHHVALITGGGRGIGEAIAIQLADSGAAVAVVGISSQDIDEVALEIAEAGGNAIALAGDVTDPTELEQIYDEVTRHFGPVDILINNGAVIGPLGAFAESQMDEWEYAHAVNLLAPVRLTRMVLPTMLERGWGRIVNISTGALLVPARNDTFNSYLASKAALESHTLNLAGQIAGSGVTANVLHPGVVDASANSPGREHDSERIGFKFPVRFLQRHLGGPELHPVVPAVALRDLVFGDRNGEIVSVRAALDPQ